MKAITTRFIPATDTKVATVRAYAHGVKSLTVNHWGQDDSHLEAALALARRQGWTGKLLRGGLPDGRGDAFVFVEGKTYDI